MLELSVEEAEESAQRLVNAVRDQPIVIDETGTKISVTISAGVAGVPAHASSASAIVTSADKALYRAKHEGRDRVVVAD